jgi:hypothetical protein
LIKGLLQSPVPSTGVIPWTIDNKYYTADVHFRLLQLIGDDDVEDLKAAVLVYAFEGNVSQVSIMLSI